jgi:hypothetical protein
MRALLVLALVGTAHANDGKDHTKTLNKRPLPLAGKKPPKLVNIRNTWTNEWLAVEVGTTPPKVVVNKFLRDHFTNKPSEMDPKLIGILMSAAANFNSDTVMLVSGFRHPKYNLVLRKKGHQVARDSQHTHGNAVDFFIPRVTTMQLHAWAKEQAIGGVGLYLDSGFVHMDTGKIRFWSGE